MREPIDEFASKLRALRKSQKRSAHDLSLKIGRKKGYVAEWERSTIGINRESLQKVIAELSLSDADGRELFRLAALRETPDAARRFIPITEDAAILNATSVLAWLHRDLEDGIDTPRPSYHVLEALSWILSSPPCAVESILHFTSIQWPDVVYEFGVLPESQRRRSPHALPMDIAEKYVPGFNVKSAGADSARQLADGMAGAYRLWCLSEIDRCRICSRQIEVWSLGTGEGQRSRIHLAYSNAKHAVENIEGVSAVVISSVKRRELAAFLYESENTRSPDDTLSVYPYQYGTLDFSTMFAVPLARRVINGDIDSLTPFELQAIRDAHYVAHSRAWQSPLFFVDVARSAQGLSLSDRPDDLLKRGAIGRRARMALRNSILDTLDDSLRIIIREEGRRPELSDIERSRLSMLRKMFLSEGQSNPTKTKPAKRAKKRPSAKRKKK